MDIMPTAGWTPACAGVSHTGAVCPDIGVHLAQHFRMTAQNGTQTRGRGRAQPVFPRIIRDTLFPGGGFRPGRVLPRAAGFLNFGLFQAGFGGPSGHICLLCSFVLKLLEPAPRIDGAGQLRLHVQGHEDFLIAPARARGIRYIIMKPGIQHGGIHR